MNFAESKIIGCYEIQPMIHQDNRGIFVKTFNANLFKNNGLTTDFSEEYYSISAKGVVRGMHFQTPPHDHVKLVYCTSGSVMDVVVDLRRGSPTYGEHAVFELSAERANMIYLPTGMAHGFCALREQTIMMYKVSTVYSSESDKGILWDSVGVDWPVDKPIISNRDRAFPRLDAFETPFAYSGCNCG